MSGNEHYLRLLSESFFYEAIVLHIIADEQGNSTMRCVKDSHGISIKTSIHGITLSILLEDSPIAADEDRGDKSGFVVAGLLNHTTNYDTNPIRFGYFGDQGKLRINIQ